ncbi:hypothetical protein Tco_0981654 [Tanacetum coccineum]
MIINELMELCTSLSQRVLDLEKTKTSQAAEIIDLKKRVKQLERKRKSKTLGLKRLFKIGRSARVVSSEDEGLGDQEDASKKGRKIDEIDQDAEVTLVDETQGRYDDNLMFDIGVLDNEQDMAEKEVDMAERMLVLLIQLLLLAKDKGKAKMVKLEKPLKKKDQILIDEEITQRLQEELQAELEEEERLARQKEEDANIAEWDNVQAMIDADYELAARLQAQEQDEFTIKERSNMFVELMDKRKKHFERLRAEDQRRKPPTKAQKRSQMSTYLKHMAGYKQN